MASREEHETVRDRFGFGGSFEKHFGFGGSSKTHFGFGGSFVLLVGPHIKVAKVTFAIIRRVRASVDRRKRLGAFL